MAMLTDCLPLDLIPSSSVVAFVTFAKISDNLLHSHVPRHDWFCWILGSVCYVLCPLKKSTLIEEGASALFPLPTAEIAELVAATTSTSTRHVRRIHRDMGNRHSHNVVATSA